MREDILKIHSHRKHKIKNSIGVYDIYKMIRKEGWPNLSTAPTEKEFYSIVRTVGKLLAAKLSTGSDIVLPSRMGSLELRKYDSSPKIVNGKLKVRYPVDWNQTLKLWEVDSLSYHDKIVVRALVKYIYYVYYNKARANYNNKSFYKFSINREIKKALKENILRNKIDAFIIK